MIDIPDSILPKNESGQTVCPKCQHPVDQCSCQTYESKSKKQKTCTPTVQLDKKGRRGKVVTLIKNLPSDDAYLKKLAKQLKSQTGSGGTFYIEGDMGIVEVQGDHVKKIEEVLGHNKEGLCR